MEREWQQIRRQHEAVASPPRDERRRGGGELGLERIANTRRVLRGVSVPTAIGNRAFSALVARYGDPAAASWNGPHELGAAANAFEASMKLAAVRTQAGALEKAGFEDLAGISEEAKEWQGTLGWRPDRSLTEAEAERLTRFGRDFEAASAPAVAQLAAKLVRELEAWTAPLSDADLVPLREHVHDQFVHGGDEHEVAEAVELLGRAEQLVGEIEKWVGRAAKAAELIGRAKRLATIHDGNEKISGKLGEAVTLVELAQSIGKLSGEDDVDAIDGALGVADFVISESGVPGFGALWDGYIGKAAEICLERLRSIRSAVYEADREGDIAMFFHEHRGDPGAPAISRAGIHFNQDEHFPGGQAMLNYMWHAMRCPDALDSHPWRVVPHEVEDYFLERRDEFDAGAKGELKAEFNLTRRDEAPNLARWIKRNRQHVWVKLYGGMPAPG